MVHPMYFKVNVVLLNLVALITAVALSFSFFFFQTNFDINFVIVYSYTCLGVEIVNY